MKFTFDIDPKTSGVNLSIEGGNSLSELQGKFVILNFLKTKLHDKSMSKEEIANCNLCKLKIAINKYLRGEKENQFKR